MASKKNQARVPQSDEERAAHLEDLLADDNLPAVSREHYIAALAVLGYDYDDEEGEEGEEGED